MHLQTIVYGICSLVFAASSATMLMPLTIRPWCRVITYPGKRRLTRHISSRKTSDPLRILFCGSDDFSISSLKAVCEEREKFPESVASIDVVCRPGKRVGRGLKSIREVPIAGVARSLNLPLHEIDTFTGWTPPLPQDGPINLVIAVSFGRLVPPRILAGAKYGGLNVHPSMLPDFHGPAPIHHTLLNNCNATGVTLQTMHPQLFDQGVILDQTPLPGFEHKCTTPSGLAMVMAPLGAEMLVRAIKERTFVPPLEPKGWARSGEDGFRRYASKITPEDRNVDWHTWTAEEILRKQRVIGPLWNLATLPSVPGTRERRIIWSSGFTMVPNSEPMRDIMGETGVPYSSASVGNHPTFLIKTCDDCVLQAEKIKLDGEREKDAAVALNSFASGNKVWLGANVTNDCLGECD